MPKHTNTRTGKDTCNTFCKEEKKDLKASLKRTPEFQFFAFLGQRLVDILARAQSSWKPFFN